MSTQESSISEFGLENSTSATQRTLEEIQLARFASQLRELNSTRGLVRALGEDPDQYASRLVKRYRDLALKLRTPPPQRARSLPPRLAETLNKLGDIFNLWQSILAPNATVALVQTPNSPDAGGSIGADIYQGDVALGGEVFNSGTQEQWWINTWQYMVSFPTTPSGLVSPASLSYRFNASTALNLYRQDVVSGSVYVYATVATTNDLINHPVDFNNYTSSDFLINSTLPVSAVPPLISGSASISGAIPLVPGRTPAIGIIVGLIVSVADGTVQILPGEYSDISIAPPDATMASELGKIEYRFDPPFWVDAVAKMIDEPL